MRTPAIADADRPAAGATLHALDSLIERVHDDARRQASQADHATAATLTAIAEHCRDAASSLRASQSRDDCPPSRSTGSAAPTISVPDLTTYTSACLQLAIDVLGNEEQPLSPLEVLAITRAVTALCAAHTQAQELAP